MEFTGEVGDVVLIHPFMLHSASSNVSGKARFITNPAVSLTEPLNLNRDNGDDYNLVEKKILKDLGAERLDFQITAERHRVVPERVRIQQEMREQQEARLKAQS